MKTIRFKQPITLTLEQKTDGDYEEERFFAKGSTLVLEGIDYGDTPTFPDLYLPKETGWVARGIHVSAFEVL